MDETLARLQLEKFGKQYARLKRTQEDLLHAVIAAVETGIPHNEITRLSGYNREHVRRIAHGWRPKRGNANGSRPN